MNIGLDATYSIGRELSGVGVYCRTMVEGLAQHLPADRLRYYYRPHTLLRGLRTPQHPWWASRVLFEKGRPGGLDLFHGLNQRLPATRYRRTVVTFHDLFVLTGEYSSAEFRKRFTRQAREAAARASLIIAVSHFTASQVNELLGVDSKRIHVVWHGVTPVKVDRAARRQKVILSVGTIQTRKNTIRLVEAFERLRDTEWRLVLAGSPGGYGSEEIAEQLHNSPARERITITGWVPEQELTRLYRTASVFAFPSLDEGFGMPLLEAMAHGVPVLTSGRSALPEVAGDAALLVDPFSVEEIRAGLETLIHDAPLRAQLIERGFRRVEQFSWDSALSQTANIYHSLCG